MAASAQFDGLVLAGGRAVRFGRDKRIEKFEGETLAGRAVRKLQQAGAGVVYVATGRQVETLPGTEGAVALCDEPPGCGPLGGIHAALLRSRAGVLALAADVPLVEVRTLENLAALGVRRDRPVALRRGGRWEPLVAFYPRSVLNDVRAAIDQGTYAPHKLLERSGALEVAPVSENETANVNMPEDLERIGKDGADR